MLWWLLECQKTIGFQAVTLVIVRQPWEISLNAWDHNLRSASVRLAHNAWELAGIQCLIATLLGYSSNSLETITDQSSTHKATNLKKCDNLLCDSCRLTFFSLLIYLLFSPHPSFHSWKTTSIKNNKDGKVREVVFLCTPASFGSAAAYPLTKRLENEPTILDRIKWNN